jgi:hypothetical protein
MLLHYTSHVGLASDLGLGGGDVFSSLINVNAIEAADDTLGLEVDYLSN